MSAAFAGNEKPTKMTNNKIAVFAFIILSMGPPRRQQALWFAGMYSH
jgi:hypothetical protein